jgi:endonuclease/exonuclease/phosphatase (EEP) superfamily protein YafD
LAQDGPQHDHHPHVRERRPRTPPAAQHLVHRRLQKRGLSRVDFGHHTRQYFGVTPQAEMSDDAAVLAPGDFNGTMDMRQFRDVLTDGYADAAHQAGMPFVATYPADRLAPAIAIDHVLTRHATGTDITTVRVAGTDHMALIADVIIRT